MRRIVMTVMYLVLVSCTLQGEAVAAVAHGRKVTDARYSIGFYLPLSWKHPVVTTSTSTTTKLLVQNDVKSIVEGVVQVQVLSGRHTNVADIANGLLASTPGAKVVGSGIVSFSFGKAEQLEFTIQSGTALVYGTAEAFFQHHVSYIVAFDATAPSINRVTRASVMNSWGV